MSGYIKMTLAERVAGKLRQEIGERRWGRELPGIRTLADEMGVSKATMTKALQVLEAWGVVEPVVKGKARRVVESEVLGQVTGVGATPVACPRVVMLTRISYDRLGRVDREFYGHLLRLFEEQGRRVSVVTAATGDMSEDELRCMVADHPADIYVIWNSGEHVARWFRQHRIRAVFVGGQFRPGSACLVSFSGQVVVEQALGHLIGLGHRRIVLPRIGKPDDSGGITLAVQRLFKEAGIQFGPYNMPFWDGDPDGFIDLLRRSFQLTPPTALVVWSAPLVPALWSFMIEQGIRCPEDLSVVLLDDNPLLDTMRPQLDVVEKSPKVLASRMAAKVAELALAQVDDETATQSVLIGGKLRVRGSSRSLVAAVK
ncbi:substrate-binding domain-containing protein [Sulfuriroseicoccus oceanibius]|uniref:LacI family DNA-binding transcriptional regulator n=1 Tax=Sulfuriroseicoccus oceanibius TaxID=2707525 RepID=A0A6B3LDP7_9BACT|nr:substrate-binding domain-containing protein [Sulfuriroseicoccus oceanibius]QQL44908.1 LacI family DNA-binding transcriptional regulator [Sulfuriroseicoccus oceanibius]